MNQEDFTYILQQPQALTHQQTDAIKSIIDEFPYFQSARAIYLKGLKDQSSFKYNQELKTTAAYTTDRSILFDFITSDVFYQNEISQSIRHNVGHLSDIEVDVEDISVNKKVSIDDYLNRQIEETTGVLDPALFEPKTVETKEINKVLDNTETKNTATEEAKSQSSPEAVLNLGKPLEFDKQETHSFNEWLKLTRFKPIDRETKIETPATKPIKPTKITEEKTTSKSIQDLERTKKFELIEQFITKNPKIKPSKTSHSKVNLAKAQNIQPEELMTETLARIYVEQKNFKKAIQSYKILSLKYPEKSSFFANQIKAVEELQEQYNTKK
ncbi:hypothetical protein [Gaetbulibacter saemankumensis]|uniref:hypothetical protein n=1 Tax=Gaetbulibacter saemankumensis TaxID=311208 RepID=UPI0004296D47|nr:hypothetical protein [Gaetbulibacter saemankumensis]